MNEPSRADYYAMQVAYEVACSASREPGRVRWDGFRIKFEERDAAPKKVTRAEVEVAKARWLGAVGYGRD